MSRSRRLTLVVELAQKKEKEAASQLQASREKLAQERERLEEITRYYQDYEQQFSSRQKNIRAEQLASHRQFLEKLSQTRQVQAIQISNCESQIENLKKVWLQHHLKTKNLIAYVEKIRQEEVREEDKKEQKLVDEWVTQRRATRGEF